MNRLQPAMKATILENPKSKHRAKHTRKIVSPFSFIKNAFTAANFLFLPVSASASVVNNPRSAIQPDGQAAGAIFEGRKSLNSFMLPVVPTNLEQQQEESRGSLLSAPFEIPSYNQYLAPKVTFNGSAEFQVLDGGTLGMQAVLNTPSKANSQLFTMLDSGEIQQSDQVNGDAICLTVTAASHAGKPVVKTWHCSGYDDQKWNFSDQGDNWYSIKPLHYADYCLDVAYFGPVEHKPIQIDLCDGNPKQAWMLIDAAISPEA